MTTVTAYCALKNIVTAVTVVTRSTVLCRFQQSKNVSICISKYGIWQHKCPLVRENPETPARLRLLVRRKTMRRNKIRKERFMRKRNKHISVWMTEQEYTHLKQQAARSGLGMDPFIRNLVQGIRICEKPPEQYVDMLQELSAIGNNVNQIAHWANSKGYASQAEIHEAAVRVNEAYMMVRDAFR